MDAAKHTSSTYMIRDVELDDAQSIAAIYGEHVRTGTATFDISAPTLNTMAEKIAEFQTHGWPFLILEERGEILGYAYASPFRNRPAYAATCENSIYVASQSRGRGIGSLLLNALIEAATKKGFRQMIAVVGGGEPASIALHGKLGFEHAGRMRSVGRKFGRWLDTVYMQRPLGMGDTQPPETEPG
jgi:L-amino acid N-acyltransferase YncA